MKRTVLCSILFLVIGFAVGIFYATQFDVPSGSMVPSSITMASVTVPSSQSIAPATASSAAAGSSSFQQERNTLLLAQATEVTQILNRHDYEALASCIHPDKGVTFTPYATVDPDRDLCFTAAQVSSLETNRHTYVWGTDVTTGSPIELTMQDYFARYVCNADYSQAPQIGIDSVIATGNALENAAAAFPDGRFVEFYYPGLNSNKEGYDWCALKLVFEAKDEQWYLVGIIHSEWTA